PKGHSRSAPWHHVVVHGPPPPKEDEVDEEGGYGSRPEGAGIVVRDDKLDNFWPQNSSQWDYWLHAQDPKTGTFFNGNTDDSIGVEQWAERGIAGRGVLLDMVRWAEAKGDPIDWLAKRPFSPADLGDAAASQNVRITEGTVLLIRSGWESGYL